MDHLQKTSLFPTHLGFVVPAGCRMMLGSPQHGSPHRPLR